MTVRELLARIDSRELAEWQLFYNMEPWGTEIEDYRAGIIASTIANANRDPKKQRKPFTPEDYMPKRSTRRDKPEQTDEDMRRIVEMWHKALGGR